MASIASNGNAINKVEFFGGSTLLGAAFSPPYSVVWSNLVSGNAYSVQARAWYGPANYSVSSSVTSFTVRIPIISTLTLLDGTLTLQWSGALPPYQVQTATNVAAPVWENVGSATTNASMVLVPAAASSYYRVVGH